MRQLCFVSLFTALLSTMVLAQSTSIVSPISQPLVPNQTVTITPDSAPVSSSSSLSRTFFSMNWNHFINSSTWPSVPFGGIRLWDNHVSWEDINTASSTYNWTNLDKWLAAAQASDTDVLYTFGRTPQWASLRPSEQCGYGYGCAAPPSDIASGDNIWKAFVTALVEHSLVSPTAHIKYYELWNEPDCTTNCTWTGTDAQLVTMASDAYTIIHNLDPNAVVLGPSPHGLDVVSWLQRYYAAGGAPYQDGVAFHAYVGTNLNQLPSIVSNTRALMAQYGIGNEPVWVTEGNWGMAGLTDSQKVAYLGQAYILLWAQNVPRFYWYTWDDSNRWGGLTNASSAASTGEAINAAGIAYGLLEDWLVGSVHSSSPCHETADSTWHCRLTLADDDSAEIVWNPHTATTITIGTAFTTYRTLRNRAIHSIVGNTVSVGIKPILLVAKRAIPPVVSSFTTPAAANNHPDPSHQD